MMMAFQQAIVARQREEVRDDPCEQQDRAQDETGSSGDNFQTFSDGEDLWYAMEDGQYEATIGPREDRQKLMQT